MKTRTSRWGRKGKNAARQAYEAVETKLMAMEGRRSVRAKTREVSRVGKRAAKVGLLVGALGALEVVLQELARRHKHA
jgi:hypothetical protein